MSNSSRNVINATSNVAKPQSEKNEEALALRRKKLLSEIKQLKLLISVTECRLSTMRFKDIKMAKKFYKDSSTLNVFQPIDVEVSIKNELHTMAGIYCKKMGNGFIFSFQCWEITGFKSSYWIQLFSDSDSWHLGLWVLPMSVDVKDILAINPIDSSTGMMRFLRECRHCIDCYNRRKQQYKELETFISDLNLYNCYVEADNGFTRITMKLVKEPSSSFVEPRTILVLLYYKKNQTRTSRMIIDCDDARELSGDETKKLRLYFKSFKDLDLKEAAEKILMEPESQSIWRRASPKDNLIEVEEDQEDDIEATFVRMFEKHSRNLKKRANDEADENENVNGDKDTSIEINNDPSSDEVSRSNGSDVASQPKKRKIPRKTSVAKRKIRKTGNTRENIENDILIDGDTLKRAKSGEKLPLKDSNVNVVNSSTRIVPRKEKTLKKSSKSEQSKIGQVFSPKKIDTNGRKFTKRFEEIAKRGEKMFNSMDKVKKSLQCSTPKIGAKVEPPKIMTDDISEIAEEDEDFLGNAAGIEFDHLNGKNDRDKFTSNVESRDSGDNAAAENVDNKKETKKKSNISTRGRRAVTTRSRKKF